MTTPRRLTRVVVVVPARDEEETIGRCLAGLERATHRCPVPVDVTVVADRCSDATAQTAAAAGVRVVVSTAGAVGPARAAGVAAALVDVPHEQWATTWIASTDADSVVAGGWLRHQVETADSGVDLLLGTVLLPGPAGSHTGWRARYAAGTWGTGHLHVHGANLGVRASTYVAAGGFPPLPAHEDRVLTDRVRELPGVRVRSSTRCPVLTSDRLLGRAPEGVARDLSA
ncbi:glycosyltransferase family 2 protein [Kineococcus sp. SYSU DK003]|uniref:glycosyltransferase n=1 Tax=Kineococcus sp. SYSU DK003 TaxID=3383124 RepID=UPI003D7E6673